MDVGVAELSTELTATKDVGLVANDCDGVVRACQC